MTSAAVAPVPRRMSREDIVRLGQTGRPWDFVPVGLQGLKIAPSDAGLRILLAANLAKLGMRTLALEQLDTLEPAVASDASVQGLRRAVSVLPDDRLDPEVLQAVCRGNLDTLAGRGTDLRAHLPAWRKAARSCDWFRASDGNIVRRRGDAWLGLGDQRTGAAVFVAEHLPPGGKRANHYTVEGADPPWLLLKLAEAATREKEGFWPRLVIIQSDPIEFLDGLAQADLRAVLREERTSVFVGEGAGPRLLADLRARMAGQIVGAYIPQRAVRSKISPGVSDILTQVEREQIQEHERLHAQVTAMYRGRDTAWWARRYAEAGRKGGGGPLRILVPSCRYTTYVQHACRDLVAAFRNAGCEAELHIEEHDSFRFSTVSYLRAIARLEPDLIVMVNYTRANIGDWIPPEIPFVCWIQDSMPHQFKAEIGAAQTERDFLVGHLHDELFTQFGFPRNRTLRIPVVASSAKFHSGPVAKDLAERFACDIAFLSHHSETPEAMHARLLSEAGPDPQTRAILEALRPEVLRIAADPASRYALTALREATAAIIQKSIGREPKASAVIAIYRQYTLPMADRALRHQTLTWAADIADRRGWRLQIYGRGWEAHPRFGRYAKGPVAHGEELRACYQAAGVHLHASISAMMHQRVLETALSGGLPIIRLLKDALAVDQWRLAQALRQTLPRSAFQEWDGYLGLSVADHPAAMAHAALCQRLGLEAPEKIWIPVQDPAKAPGGPPLFLETMTPEYDPAWLMGDLAQASFSDADRLETALTRAIENPAWRAAMSSLIASRARERLTHDTLARKALTMIKESLGVVAPDVLDDQASAEAMQFSGSGLAPKDWTAETLACHRRLRARMGRPVDEASIRRMPERYRPPEWVSGFISLDDAVFLYDMARCVEPDRILEIGTASGVSAAVLLMALSDIGRGMRDESGTPRLYTYDISPWCYFDTSRPVGSAVDDMVPQLAGGVIVRTKAGAATAGREFADRPVDFAFLDANHCHPYPIADILALQPALKPGAWVVIHDVNLPRVAREHEERTGVKVNWHQAGVEQLLAHWPHEKIAGESGAFNIGAIRMPLSGRLAVQDFKALIDLPWETKVHQEYLELLGRA